MPLLVHSAHMPCVSKIFAGVWFCLLRGIYKRFTIDCGSVWMTTKVQS